ncbi:hypothetical protein P3T76_013846 [Phytophthora citrophthora]|uniref:Uncharacterized protein n=1 Tax=Phytophthora citrophthora TaxID=4793 RepID=A0AAD9G1X5_9STRA|nr:hypothetical protein P3T76_013846 [Phytophthora citrophthora]
MKDARAGGNRAMPACCVDRILVMQMATVMSGADDNESECAFDFSTVDLFQCCAGLQMGRNNKGHFENVSAGDSSGTLLRGQIATNIVWHEIRDRKDGNRNSKNGNRRHVRSAFNLAQDS